MKKIGLLILIIVLAFLAGCSPKYNLKLARQLGADDYGMKNYILVILKTGPNTTTDKTVLDSLFRGHMANINKLSEEGKMIVAGPFQKNKNQYRGIFILDVKDMNEVSEQLQYDPAIREKIFEVEMYNWYGSAALPVYLKTHSAIEKTRP